MPALPSPPFKAQDQRAVTDQLRDLVILATREGFYDAADLIQEALLKPRDARLTTGEILRAVSSDTISLSDEVSAILASQKDTVRPPGSSTPPSDDTEKG